MNQISKRLFLLVAMMALASPVAAADADRPWLKPDPAAVKRFRDMRFGMFIHWGPVSLTGHEIGWSRGQETPVEVYDNLYKNFNPTKFDADKWVSVAKAAGAKYIVFTTKHHDGFCMFDTKLTDFNIMNSPLKRDVTKELADACRKQGIAFGTYHSVCDWHHPDFPLTSPGGRIKREKSDIDAYNRYLLGQMKELITHYGPLLVMWNDVPQMFEGRGYKTIEMVRTLQPDILINDRTGDGGDYGTPEQKVGDFNTERLWETCHTICDQWAWKPNDRLKSLKECIDILVQTAGNDGNLLFNVGPEPTGEIEPRQVERLKEMGQWVAKYGESIYGTRGGPYKPTKQIACTHKGNTVYVHVLKWDGGALMLPALPQKVTNSLLLTGGTVKIDQSDSGLQIMVAPQHRQALDTIVKLELAEPAR